MKIYEKMFVIFKCMMELNCCRFYDYSPLEIVCVIQWVTGVYLDKDSQQKLIEMIIDYRGY